MGRYYVASDSNDERDGIYLVDAEGETARRVARCGRPSSLAWHPTHRLLFGIGCGANDQLLVWRPRVDGSLELVHVRSLTGEGSCALEVDPRAEAVYVTHYQSGSVSRVALDRAGTPGEHTLIELTGSRPDPVRQPMSHPHHVRVLSSGRVLVTDLGADRGWLVDARAFALTSSIQLPSGSGPRHAVELPDGRVAFCGELDQTVVVVSADGQESVVCPSTQRTSDERNYPSDLVCHPDRDDTSVIIIANRGTNSLMTFRVDAGGVAPIAEVDSAGQWPQSLELNGMQLAVANRDSDRVSFFQTGRPDASPAYSSFVTVPHPVWVISAHHPVLSQRTTEQGATL